MLICDDCALVEQYHYGKIRQGDEAAIGRNLGGDVPLVEYAKFESSDPLKNPYLIFADHFTYAFAQSESEITVDKPRTQMSRILSSSVPQGTQNSHLIPITGSEPVVELSGRRDLS
jgi:hypothetical protein